MPISHLCCHDRSKTTQIDNDAYVRDVGSMTEESDFNLNCNDITNNYLNVIVEDTDQLRYTICKRGKLLLYCYKQIETLLRTWDAFLVKECQDVFLVEL